MRICETLVIIRIDYSVFIIARTLYNELKRIASAYFVKILLTKIVVGIRIEYELKMRIKFCGLLNNANNPHL